MLDVLSVEVDDGVVFEPSGLRARMIRDADPYTGVRVTVPARVDRARHPLRVDVSVGDPVTPRPVEVRYPALIGDAFSIVGYPLETVLAEKIVTMIDRGDATTRDRDFADVYVLTGRHVVEAETFAAALRATAGHRGSDLRSLRSALVNLASARTDGVGTVCVRAGLTEIVPASYADTIEAVAAFADPILADAVRLGTWDPTNRRWADRV